MQAIKKLDHLVALTVTFTYTPLCNLYVDNETTWGHSSASKPLICTFNCVLAQMSNQWLSWGQLDEFSLAEKVKMSSWSSNWAQQFGRQCFFYFLLFFLASATQAQQTADPECNCLKVQFLVPEGGNSRWVAVSWVMICSWRRKHGCNLKKHHSSLTARACRHHRLSNLRADGPPFCFPFRKVTIQIQP